MLSSFCIILIPNPVTWFRCDSAVLSGFLLMFIACIVWLKLVSFAHTNHDIRQLTISSKKVHFHHFPSFFVSCALMACLDDGGLGREGSR